jgi:hypothetical protein
MSMNQGFELPVRSTHEASMILRHVDIIETLESCLPFPAVDPAECSPDWTEPVNLFTTLVKRKGISFTHITRKSFHEDVEERLQFARTSSSTPGIECSLPSAWPSFTSGQPFTDTRSI